MPFRREDMAYAAGFYEGEGTITRRYGDFRTRSGERRQRKSPQFQLRVGSTDLEPLEQMHMALGFGVIYGPYTHNSSKPSNWKPYYVYAITSFEQCQAAIAAMWHWLSPRRRDQARFALTGR